MPIPEYPHRDCRIMLRVQEDESIKAMMKGMAERLGITATKIARAKNRSASEKARRHREATPGNRRWGFDAVLTALRDCKDPAEFTMPQISNWLKRTPGVVSHGHRDPAHRQDHQEGRCRRHGDLELRGDAVERILNGGSRIRRKSPQHYGKSCEQHVFACGSCTSRNKSDFIFALILFPSLSCVMRRPRGAPPLSARLVACQSGHRFFNSRPWTARGNHAE